jgi:hypothetical protein
MKTIHKFVLDYGTTNISLPLCSEVLTAQMQHDAICLWVAVDTDQATCIRTFIVKGTGHALPERGLRYVSTVQEGGGALVWHVFEQMFVEDRA